jgi:hypothetical protein
MEIEVAFYKGEGNFLNKLVRWWTNSRYSHAELVLPDQKTWLGISPFLKSEVNSREKVLVDHDEWDLIKISVTEEQRATIIDFFDETRGCGYDWIGMLLSQFLPCRIKHRDRWYCSEWIAYALRIACIIDWKIIKIYSRKDLSPGVLYTIVQRINEEEEAKEI